ncbi:M1 family metallopeptidase [Pseudomarimonas arenosa]|uniref:Aminopeptidase N n=1 Tax=Pseudomarimonas arenosa TaxID=2774145 RepID=A0AAW3ZGF1_9GAMM|nr:M1 family metallopeptidase [Pseudomarimonas arenosa]MBD8525091.1 M1 family metallopeptidase [Pseudomarimonas arenosa]
MRFMLFALLGLLLSSTVFASDAAPRAGDEHSYAEPDKVRVVDLGLDLRIDFDQRMIKGSADLQLEWTDPEHRRLQLDTRELVIDKVMGKRRDSGWFRLQWSLSEKDPILGQMLSIKMPRQYETVRIRYRTSPEASGLLWLPAELTAGKRLPFMFSQSQAIHARSWVPLQDTPAVRYTYSAHIESDPKLMVLMSADNQPDTARDGDYVFRMTQPIPSYLMAIAAGDLVFKPISERAGVWAEPATVDAAVAEFSDTEQMIQAAESLYGPYRWGRYDLLILPPSFPYGGMENPRLSFITPTVITGDKSLVALIAHELAHSWSGNLVTNASWKDIWLNEGFTNYVEGRISEAVYGQDFADMEVVINRTALADELKEVPPEQQILILPRQEGKNPDEALSDVAYVKGHWFLSFLEQRFGREIFDPFLRSWFDQHAFESVSSEDFVDHLRTVLLPQKPNAVSEKELQAWLHQAGVPKVAPKVQSERLQAVDKARQRWLKGRTLAKDLDTSGWVTQQWLHLLDGMPNELDGEQMVELDQAFNFTGTANGEIAMRWYPLALRSGYFEARPAIAEFLQTIGRRKLIMPIYQELAKSKDGLQFARDVFAQARAGYHPITIASIEALFAEAKGG